MCTNYFEFYSNSIKHTAKCQQIRAGAMIKLPLLKLPISFSSDPLFHTPACAGELSAVAAVLGGLWDTAVTSEMLFTSKDGTTQVRSIQVVFQPYF